MAFTKGTRVARTKYLALNGTLHVISGTSHVALPQAKVPKQVSECEEGTRLICVTAATKFEAMQEAVAGCYKFSQLRLDEALASHHESFEQHLLVSSTCFITTSDSASSRTYTAQAVITPPVKKQQLNSHQKRTKEPKLQSQLESQLL